MRIAVVIKRFVSTGGAEKYAVEVTRRLLEKGYDIELITREADAECASGLTVHRVPDRLGFSSAVHLYAFARDARTVLEKHHYDIIHSHDRTFCQDVATIHTFPYRKGLDRYKGWRKIDQLYLSPRNALHLYLEKRQMASPYLVPVSHIIRNDIDRYHGRQEKVKVIEPGVDTDFFHPHAEPGKRQEIRGAEGLNRDDMVILFVGSEFRRKGLDYLLPAISGHMKLVVVGRGEHIDQYRRQIDELGIGNRVIFKGLVEDVRNYYAMADILVLPSVLEAFGMTVLEGMAAGIPVVASSTTGVAGLLRNNENGMVFDRYEELPGLLQKLAGDNGLRRRLGENGRSTAQDRRWQRVTQQYEELFMEILDKKTG